MRKNELIKTIFLGLNGIFFLLFNTSVKTYTDSEDIYALNLTPPTSYQKALEISLKIWADLQALHRGTLATGNSLQECAVILDLTVGRMCYLKKCLACCIADNTPLDRDDISYLNHVMEYILQDCEHLLLYDTDRASSIEQLLQDIVKQLHIISAEPTDS